MKFLKLFLVPFASLFACTDLVIGTQDGAFLNGRSMEFAIPTSPKLSLNPRGQEKQSKAPNNQPGLKWTSKYGYLSIDCLEQGFTADGMNEQGLSISVLWFPGVQYPSPTPDMAPKAVVLQDVGPWILGNFATVDEARAALPTIAIWAESIDPVGIPPTHLAIHDAKGNHCVVEFNKGKMEILDNPNGVMTNAPKLEWHLTNLRNYINLSALNAGPVNLNGTVLQPTSQGSGLLGVPGDWTSPSRFVRTTLFKSFAVTQPTASAGVNLLEHLLNTVDIPFGTVRAGTTTSTFELTQWAVIKDMKNKILYYRTYEDLTLRSIDLKKLDFTTAKSVPLKATPKPVDMTSLLLK